MSADIAELALVCYRTPLAYQDQLAPSVPLPPDMDRLLALANASGSTCDDAARQFGARPDEVRDAARFLVQRLCFGRGATHYRVLGLAPDAPPEQVKEHHRRLMWLFHPDRVAGRESWTEGYAARVNEAWALLSHPASRARYDARLLQSESSPAAGTVGAWSAPRPLVPVGSAPSRAGRRIRQRRPLWRRWLPLVVLGGCALGAALLVVTVQLSLTSNAPRLYAPAAGNGTAPPPDLSAQLAGLEQARDQRIAALSPDRQPRPAAVSAAPVVVASAGAASAAPQPAGSSPSAVASELVLPVGAVAPLAQPPVPLAGLAQTLQRDSDQGPVQENRTGLPLVASIPSGAAPKVAPTPANPSARDGPAPVPQSTPERIPAGVKLTDREVQTLIDRYTEAYRRGDLNGVMVLFTSGARGKGGSDRGSVRRDYGNLFEAFLIRRFQLSGLKWSLRGDRAKVSGRYELWLRGRGDGQQTQWTGNIHFRLRKHEGRVMIDAIDYDWPSPARG
jgi:ketosteroid isomerase-like protein